MLLHSMLSCHVFIYINNNNNNKPPTTNFCSNHGYLVTNLVQLLMCDLCTKKTNTTILSKSAESWLLLSKQRDTYKSLRSCAAATRLQLRIKSATIHFFIHSELQA